MKGVGHLTYHLGTDFFCDDDRTLCLGSQTYSKHLCATFKSLYGEQPKPVFSPLDHEEHPELNDLPLCGPDDVAKFQSLIGACQWMISLCHLDIAHAIMSLSCFLHCPHIGHVDWLKCLSGYICKFPQGSICFWIGIPDHESIFGNTPIKHDWMELVYRCLTEELPDDSPPLKGNHVQTSAHCDTNLLHDVKMVRSASDILRFFNQMLVEWFSK